MQRLLIQARKPLANIILPEMVRRASLPLLLLAMTATSCWQRDAVLDVSTREIDFGPQLDRVSITVGNAGSDGTLTSGVTSLEYRIKADQTWITIDPVSGRCGEGEENTHVVQIDRAQLVFGNNVATIVISSNGGSRSIAVRAERDLTACTVSPSIPSNPAPSSGTADVPIGADLVWSDGASQCPGLTATYDIYFATTSPPGFDHNNGSSKYWDPGTLSRGTTYYWRIVAQDANGSTSSAEWSFTTSAAACVAGPAVLTLLAPGNGATSVSIEQNLSWAGGNSQCPGLTATYDVHFGTTSSPPLDHDNGSSKTWDPGTLSGSTTYYWQIVAKDANGSTPGPVWSFTTTSAPCTAAPGAPTLVAPLNAATSVSIEQDLSWGGGNSQCPGLTATYDVYFGTTSPPPLDHDNGSSKTWDPGTLSNSATYYWQIVAKDAKGSTPGPVWSFTTTSPPCTALPTAACNPSPTDNRVDVSENANLAWGCGDSQCDGLVATYDVYFGTRSTPGAGEFLGNTTAKAWDLPRLLKDETTYYWQIVTRDANGTSPGPIWSFTTKD